MKSLKDHPIALFLSDDDFIKNPEIAKRSNLTERRARMMIAELAKEHPVISQSDAGGGIRLPKKFTKCKSIEELEKEIKAVQLTMDQFQSRKRELNRRLRPLIAYRKAAEKEIKRRVEKHES